MRNIPVVASAQTVVSWRAKPKYDVQQRLTRRLLTRAAATIVLAPSVARVLQNEGFSGRVAVGLTSVDRAPTTGRSNPRRRLLFLSRVIPVKGVIDAVQAFSTVWPAHPDSFLEIRGDGPAREREHIKTLARRLGLEPAINVGGPINTDDEKWEVMADSAAFVAPSYMEHFGLAVREALTVGLPTIVYWLPPFEDLERHPCLIHVPQGDVQALSNAMVGALSLSGNEREELIQAAQLIEVGPTWDQAVSREEMILSAIALGTALPTEVVSV
jgi:glycosyltransferase involved in cell wall biosynthesis